MSIDCSHSGQEGDGRAVDVVGGISPGSLTSEVVRLASRGANWLWYASITFCGHDVCGGPGSVSGATAASADWVCTATLAAATLLAADGVSAIAGPR